MAATKWVVRVVLDKEQSDKWGDLIGHLDFMLYVVLHRDDSTGICFDILPPANADSQKWSAEMAEYLGRHGVNAVYAPAYPKGEAYNHE